MSKSINDIRCELIDNSNELIQNIIKYHSIVMDLQNINLLSFKIIKNQEEFTSLFKFIIDLNEKITQFNDNFKNMIKEEGLPNSKIAKTSFPDLKETPKSNQDMNPMMGGMGMNPMMGGMCMNPMMFGFPPTPTFPKNTESTNKEDLNSSKKENESENTESE